MSPTNAGVALVANGTYGVGPEIVRSLHAAGLRVAVGTRPANGGDDSLLDPPAEAASRHEGLLSSPTDCGRVVKEVLERHGRIDILVCPVLRRGFGVAVPVERIGSPEWDRHMAGKLSGPFYIARAALPPMLDQGHGRIVFVVPAEGGPGSVGEALMGVSSAGLLALTRRLAREVAARGVTVNGVAAGIVAERSTLDDMPAELAEQVKSSVPAGRFGSYEEVAAAVRYLCSPEAGYVTGQVIAVDGGFGA
jgi:3-oxoacyl-[acyl-carrier protein] reductase